MAGRPRTEIDKELFVNTITDAENEQTFTSVKALCDFIGEILSIPHYTVLNRIREWGLTLKTQPGKRGRPAGPSSCAAMPKKQATQNTECDLSELFAAFSGAGLTITSSADLVASPVKDAETNTKIRNGWQTLRQMLELPVFPPGQK